MDRQLIGITGGLGKSLTTQITRLIFEEAGFITRAVFNGEGLEEALESTCDVLVAEVRAADLLAGKAPEFDVACLLNTYFERGRWQESEEDFEAALGQVFAGAKKACVFNASDFFAERLVKAADVAQGCRAIGFSSRSPGRSEIGVVENILTDRAFYADETDPLRWLEATEIADLLALENFYSPAKTLPAYRLQNIAAAVAIARVYKISPETIRRALEQYCTPHGQNQLIGERPLLLENGFDPGVILYVDDALSDAPARTAHIFKGYPVNSIVWVTGGYANREDFAKQLPEIAPHVSEIVLIGSEDHPLYALLRAQYSSIPVRLVSLDAPETAGQRAFDAANSLAIAGQFVIYSPAGKLLLPPGEMEIEGQFEIAVDQFTERVLEYAKNVGYIND